MSGERLQDHWSSGLFLKIIDPVEHEVRIEERWEAPNRVLISALYAKNMTLSTQFECEAVNEHVGGATVKSKIFNVIVLPNSGELTFL